MADIDLKAATPDTSLPSTGFLFGADSQSATNPSVYSTQTVATALLGSTSLTGDTVATSKPVLNLSQTWDDGAGGTVTFTGLKFNATSTASAAGSLLLDIGTGGGSYTSQFSVRKDGRTTASSYYLDTLNGFGTGSSNQVMIFNEGAGAFHSFRTTGYIVRNTSHIAWSSDSTLATNSISATDLILTRRAAANLRLGAADAASPVAQTLSVQSVSSGTTNGNGTNLTITGSQSTGSGTAGLILFQTSSAGGSGTSVNGLATVATIGPNTLSGSETTPALDIAQTWNTTGVANGLRLNITNTASDANSLSFNIRVGGSSIFAVNRLGSVVFPSTITGGVASGGNSILGLDNTNGAWLRYSTNYQISVGSAGLHIHAVSATGAYLVPDAANTLALRNGGTSGTPVPQTFRIYNWTDGTNSEFGVASFFGNSFYIGTQRTGTGSTRPILFTQGQGSVIWQIDTSGHFTSGTDNTYDIGAASANRPRSIYAATSIEAAQSAYIGWNGRAAIYSDAANNIRLYGWGASIGLLQFGGTTSSFPALKRSSAKLQVVDAAGNFTSTSGLVTQNLNFQGVTIANLPGTPTSGDVAYITDGDASLAWGATAVNSGSGATKYLVWYNGTNWTIAGK